MLCFSFLCPRLNERADSDSRRRPRPAHIARGLLVFSQQKDLPTHTLIARAVLLRGYCKNYYTPYVLCYTMMKH
jgi:hypothetical protein